MMSAPFPPVTFRTCSNNASPSVLKFFGSAPKDAAFSRRDGMASMAIKCFGLNVPAAAIAQSPTGPHPITATVLLFICALLRLENPFRAA
jgi:hypothetical protein